MKTALLVVDMQNFFGPMVVDSLPNVVTLIKHFRSLDLPVIFTQHGHKKEELVADSKSQLVRKWGIDNSVHYGSKAWELLPEIDALFKQGRFPVIPKNTYDAFLGTDLEKILKEEGVERVVVCGVMTDCCCDTTGRGSFNRGWETWMVADACGTANETQHKRGLAVFEYAYGEVISTEETMARVKAAECRL
ncbi:uncharacterized protein E0L32_002179 [Thyridium curvatum]|uniref:Isochorismatase-like domain-containing protein n=1 Tax=Thyridium curvatum TaxID=1093900 RepID=A0A507AR46_9PEZI|nr:uncharacterized protein E0L32_001954 [Thyridium curvatum]XP_030989287.1 uncharacterized protein E0L32_002179 [Thyridium curvatum]TPX07351.1 hypothetical protein E0L32_001954 [Thyridium curvatum]TPX07576.1 hypothetical protein E0L32_002179 [Thyridium curvatum]